MKFLDLNTEKKQKIQLKKPGQYLIFFYNLSGEIKIEILNKNISVEIFGIYFGEKNNNFSLKTTQHHLFPKSKSNLLIRGIFFDQSQFNYEGLIKIEKKAQNSFAYQKNQNLIFSSRCLIETKPYLEILANNVYCTHGATTGQLNKDQIHYLRSRGIKINLAKKLLVEGFFNEIFNQVKNFGLENKIKKYQSIILNNLKNAQY